MHAKRMRVLLVEDKQEHAALMRQAFSSHVGKMELHLARNLQEARTSLSVSPPHVVIAALLLPDGRGTELVPADEESSVYPVMILTSRGDQQAIDEAVQTEAWDYVMKSDITLTAMPLLAERTLRAWRHSRHQRQTERALRHSEARRRQAQKMEAIAALARVTAHDFNNSLASILGYTQLALEDTRPDSVAQRYLQEVYSAGKRATEVVQQFLTFRRSSEQQLMPIPLELVITDVLNQLRASWPATIDIRLNVPAHVAVVLANRIQLQQALSYLYTHAIHAMQETGGRLDVCMEAVEVDAALVTQHPELRVGPYVRLRVRDTSHASIPEGRATSLKPLFTTRHMSEEINMEMSVGRAIVASHGGAITVQSRPREGITRTIYLPRIATAAYGDTCSQED